MYAFQSRGFSLDYLDVLSPYSLSISVMVTYSAISALKLRALLRGNGSSLTSHMLYRPRTLQHLGHHIHSLLLRHLCWTIAPVKLSRPLGKNHLRIFLCPALAKKIKIKLLDNDLLSFVIV
ncbi:transferase [Trypanosoma rangeli]|uniref:Transferase n=1 Tax=Trypanosoma rangeli TaxID=5698 RepID=A0A422NB51_TRYRA|nr:transferase [Trypanosoma rangeli]RNF02662.1 transferase [Trypanosoma rangeli]|eukprot:RNF02662.1 transferase [Trypanosoma rangeli]